MMFSAASFGPARVRVLVAETDAGIARNVAAALAAGLLNSEVEIADSLAAAERRLRGSRFSALIAGTSLGSDAAQRLRPLMRGPLLMIGAGAMTEGVEARLKGADDFLVAPFAPQILVERLLARLSERPALEADAPPSRNGFERFIGSSPAMQRVYAQIERIAASKAPVFITGESGTGKALAAKAIYTRSRVRGAFVAVHCGAMPADAVDEEIFGSAGHPGAVETAREGTLFFDDICELAPSAQAKLLHFLQTATSAPRIICATSRNPRKDVEAGRLREDLFYRLHVLPLAMPPLRNRGEDSLLLAAAFLARAAAEEGRAFTGFDPLARLLILSYAWPGNVRELEAAIRRIAVLHPSGPVTADMMPDDIAAAVLRQPHDGSNPEPIVLPAASALPPEPAPILPMWMQEERIIDEALAAFGGNIARAAAALEINPSTIYRRRAARKMAG